VKAWAVVPVKCFSRAKSRLRPLLGGEGCTRLAQFFFEHVTGELRACASVVQVVVATDCEQVAALARARGAVVVRDSPGGSLASIVDDALGYVARQGGDAAIVIMSDLPRVTAGDIDEVIEGLRRASVVVAPDRHGQGTNALALTLARRTPTSFGYEDSFHRHCDNGRAAGAQVAIVRRDGLSWDVDSPSDLARVPAYVLSGRRLRSSDGRSSWKRKRASRVRAA
jgi:2-phospho-L-lactate guanylyltransferase